MVHCRHRRVSRGDYGRLTMERYSALALQSRCDADQQTRTKTTARAAMRAAIDRIDEQIRGSFVLIGPSLKLVVLPEYFMTGYPVGDTIDGWADKAAIAVGRARVRRHCRPVAQKHKHLSVRQCLRDRRHSFPGYYFQACASSLRRTVIVVLRYRRLISMFAPTPHDVWDRISRYLRYSMQYSRSQIHQLADWRVARPRKSCSRRLRVPTHCEAPRSSCIRPVRYRALS